MHANICRICENEMKNFRDPKNKFKFYFKISIQLVKYPLIGDNRYSYTGAAPGGGPWGPWPPPKAQKNYLCPISGKIFGTIFAKTKLISSLL